MAGPLASLKVEVQISEDTPVLHVDPILIEQVLVIFSTTRPSIRRMVGSRLPRQWTANR